MCVGKFQRTSVKNHSSLFGATSFLVILASPRQEFATARAGAAVSFCPLSLRPKKVDKVLNLRFLENKPYGQPNDNEDRRQHRQEKRTNDIFLARVFLSISVHKSRLNFVNPKD